MSTDQQASKEERIAGGKIQPMLWYGVFIGIVAWKLQLVTNYALFPFLCWHRLEIVNHVLSLFFLVLALSGAYVAFRAWRHMGEAEDLTRGGVIGRSRAQAVFGIALSLYFALVIIGQWIPNVVLSACDGIS
jgi:hypothetical protein